MGYLLNIFKNMYSTFKNTELSEKKKFSFSNIDEISVDQQILQTAPQINRPWEEYESIYSYLLNTSIEDLINSNYLLPEDIINHSNSKWGELNQYLSASYEIDNIDDMIVNVATNYLIDCCNYPSEKNFSNFYNCIISNNIFIILDLIIDNIVDRQTEISYENLYLTGLWLCRDTCHRNSVLFGISLLSRIRLEEDLISVLGKCEDFVYPLCIAIITEANDVNNKLMKLSNVVSGWNKIHILNYIKPTTKNEYEWFLTNGINDKSKNPKLAELCAKKSKLDIHINDYMCNALTRDGVSKVLLNFLSDTKNCTEFINYSFNKGLIKYYVYFFESRKIYKTEKKTFKRLNKFIKSNNLSNELFDVKEILELKLNQST